MKFPLPASPLRSWRLHLAAACTALCATFATPASAQVLLEVNFTFTGPLASNGWTAFSGVGTNPLNSAAPGLTYANLPSSGAGNAASLLPTGEDAYRLLSATEPGTIYTSVLINVSAAQAGGDYFYAFYNEATTGGGYNGRVFVRSNGAGGFNFGVAKNTATAASVSYETTARSFGVTYLVVLKLTRNAGSTTDDVASLWVNPILGGSETSPGLTNNAGNDNLIGISSVALRQGSTTAAPTLSIGNILVGTTWASVTPTASASAPTITSFSPSGAPAATPVIINGTNFIGATEVTFNGVPALFSVNSSIQITATVPAGATAGFVQVTTPEGVAVSEQAFVVPTVAVTLPGAINEGASALGTVTLTEPAASDVVVSLTSSSPSDLVVPTAVTIASGFDSVEFDVEAPLDGSIDTDVDVTVTPAASGFAPEPATITVRNIDVPTVSLTAGGYTQDFATFVDATTLPLGWSITADGSGTTKLDYSSWDVIATGIKFNSATANVFGYQHTGSTGIVRQILTLRNDTGAEITDLTIAYTGRAARLDQTRFPIYKVTVDGLEQTALEYSTGDGDGVAKSASVGGLFIAPNQVFQIVWTSDRGLSSGGSRQIGASAVNITVGASALPPSVAALSVPLGSITGNTSEVSANVTGDGGSAITARGFVYAQTSVNPDPVIGGTGVTNIVDPLTELGVMNASLTGLSASTGYSVKAYAINAEGTTYTVVQTFTTLAPPASFTGSYFNAFNNFSGPNALPGEWSAFSSTGLQTYVGDWTSASFSGGFYGGVSSPGVLGYTHTAGSGTLTLSLRLVNDTGAPITELNVRYLGRVEVLDNTRFPAWTVTVAGTESAELFYTTEVGVDRTKTAAITGLNIAEGEAFTITWVSDRGLTTGGSSRRIGLADVVVSTLAIADPVINVSSALTPFAATLGSPSAAQTFSAGGSNLNGNIVVTAPTDYQVSTNGSTYGSSATLTASAGSVATTTVYVRLAATAAVGSPSGLVTIASDGATSQNVAVTGTVSAASGYESWASGFGLDPATNGAPTADPDGDSFNNAQEYAFGTNPTQGNGSLLSTTASGSNLVVTWLERGDVIYNVQSTGNLATTAFANDGTVNVVDGPVDPAPPAGYTRKQITVPASGSKFYRVTAATP